MMLRLGPYPLSASLSSLKVPAEQCVQPLPSQYDQNYQQNFLHGDMVGLLTIVLIGGGGGNIS